MPQLPVLDNKRTAADGRVSDGDIIIAEPNKKAPFKLSQLDLGSIGVSANTKGPGGRKRAAAVSAPLDDDEDPLEEAQVSQSVYEHISSRITLGTND